MSYCGPISTNALPWHRSLRDANLCNGNLFKSFTDIQVSAAKGAGLALQRSYNSQDDRLFRKRSGSNPPLKEAEAAAEAAKLQ